MDLNFHWLKSKNDNFESSLNDIEAEGFFMWYTLRMLSYIYIYMTCILDIVSILHVIILDKCHDVCLLLVTFFDLVIIG